MFEPRNEIRQSISPSMSKKGITFLRGRIPRSTPGFIKKFPTPSPVKTYCMHGVSNKFIENLLYVRLHFVKVGQHIKHDMAPLLIRQGLGGRTTCGSEWTSEKAEVRLIVASIVTGRWIMHARKVVTIVCCCEVRHLL